MFRRHRLIRGRKKESSVKISKKSKGSWDRLSVLAFLFFIGAFLIIVRLFFLQVLDHGFYVALAEGQHEIFQKLLPTRGEIFVRDSFSDGYRQIATNIDLNLVYAVPKKIVDSEETVKKLTPLLKLDEEELLFRLSKKDDLYEPLKHEIDDSTWEEIRSLDLVGIEAKKESVRFYPEGKIFSHITGFLGYDGDRRIGQYGLEGYFDRLLAGEQGFLRGEKDANGRWIMIGRKAFEEAKNGGSLILTIDPTIQFTACKVLEEAVVRHGADEGTVIIMKPETGAIVAMCNTPGFDPNRYSEAGNLNVFVNSAVSDQYEPGSVFKPIVMATALDLNKVSPNMTYTDEGQVQIGKYTIRNSDNKVHGVQTMTNVLEESLNTGAIFTVQKVGNELFEEYVKKFGFGVKTGIEFEGESSGNISSLSQNKMIYSATASYGQGITVTPLQLLVAYGAIANRGQLMRPYLVEKIISEDGFENITEPEVKQQVITPETAKKLSAMLVSVVRKGHAKRAKVSGYFVAGKTGTAQIAKKEGVGYETGRHNDTFVGFAPVDDPAFVMLVKMNDPKDVEWAEGSVVPVFGEIAKFLLEYLEVQPDDVKQEG